MRCTLIEREEQEVDNSCSIWQPIVCLWCLPATERDVYIIGQNSN